MKNIPKRRFKGGDTKKRRKKVGSHKSSFFHVRRYQLAESEPLGFQNSTDFMVAGTSLLQIENGAQAHTKVLRSQRSINKNGVGYRYQDNEVSCH